MAKKRIGEILLQRGVLEAEQLEQALSAQREEKMLLGEVLLRMGIVKQDELGKGLALQHGVPYVALGDEEVYDQVVLLLPEEFCRKHVAVPFKASGDTIHVAMVWPDNLWVRSEIHLLTGYKIKPYVSLPSGILHLLDQCFDRQMRARQTIIDMRLEELKKGGVGGKADLMSVDAVSASDVPVVRLVNSIVSGGIAGGASDVHFEPQFPEMRVRYRIDGVLYDNMLIPNHIESALVSRVKVMAELDITERRHPQDGHISFAHEGKSYDLRVSTMPTVTGEKIVLRVFEKDSSKFGVDQLGFSPEQLAAVERFISHPYGMILVTGPTGSGKSTSLYAMLNTLNKPDKNIITLEDPVENQMHGMNQIGVDANFGMSFSSGLKYILRQDPDIIMIGEIRDAETAEIAVQAALTGHLFLSTLHTNDAAGAVTRLIELGVQPFLVASSLIGVIAQRLMRKVCPDCRLPVSAPADLIDELGPYREELSNVQLYQGKGCERCFGTGYRGRCGIFELLTISPAMSEAIEGRASSNVLKQQALADGMVPLLKSGIDRVIAGESSLEEVREHVLVWEKSEEQEALAS